jgi:formylmethanofuran dehydrogenase subunit C
VLTLRLRSRPREAVDMQPLNPDRLGGRTLAQIRSVALQCGNRLVAAGDLFDVRGQAGGPLRLLGATDRLDNVGSGLQSGTIEVRGNTGHGTGAGMRDGAIRVSGDVGAYAGAGMHAGSLIVAGSAGDFLGGALAGEREGMRGGFIHVHGRAGDRAGDHQRRGLIVIDGDCGDFCGSEMRAGTILVLGTAGRYVGAGMRRGTIVLRCRPELIGATFNSCGRMKMEVLRLLFRQLRLTDRRFAPLERLGPLAQRYAGDLAAGGKGELLLLAG